MVQFDATRRTLPGLERLVNDFGNRVTPQGGPVEVLHGFVSSCREMLVKSRNERNPRPVLPWEQSRNSQETASDKLEEGGDDVKSSWPLCPGLHTCYNGRYNPSLTCEGEPIGKNRSQFGLQAATRLHEAGIASNGRSARCREYVPGPCSHRPSHHESGLY